MSFEQGRPTAAGGGGSGAGPRCLFRQHITHHTSQQERAVLDTRSSTCRSLKKCNTYPPPISCIGMPVFIRAVRLPFPLSEEYHSLTRLVSIALQFFTLHKNRPDTRPITHQHALKSHTHALTPRTHTHHTYALTPHARTHTTHAHATKHTYSHHTLTPRTHTKLADRFNLTAETRCSPPAHASSRGI